MKVYCTWHGPGYALGRGVAIRDVDEKPAPAWMGEMQPYGFVSARHMKEEPGALDRLVAAAERLNPPEPPVKPPLGPRRHA